MVEWTTTVTMTATKLEEDDGVVVVVSCFVDTNPELFRNAEPTGPIFYRDPQKLVNWFQKMSSKLLMRFTARQIISRYYFDSSSFGRRRRDKGRLHWVYGGKTKSLYSNVRE
jgi:hypothetical protein